MTSGSMQCIVCEGACRHAHSWTRAELRVAFEAKVGKPFPTDTECPDYTMWACESCGLEFPDPVIPGDAAFYGWITTMPNYYKSHRWEWDETAGLAQAVQATTLLDVGCGTGVFLDFMRSKSATTKTVGLDILAESVEACRAKGHEAVCSTLEAFVEAGDAPGFDMVTAFHCLEHVTDPVGLIRSMSSAARPGGRVVVSVPLSPPSWEVMGRDCLNMPPHHLTRWTAESLRQLGKVCHMKVQLTSDNGAMLDSIPKSVLWLFRETAGISASASWSHAAVGMAKRPDVLVKCAAFLLKRERTDDGRPVGNTALAVFTRG